MISIQKAMKAKGKYCAFQIFISGILIFSEWFFQQIKKRLETIFDGCLWSQFQRQPSYMTVMLGNHHHIELSKGGIAQFQRPEEQCSERVYFFSLNPPNE